MRRGVQYFVSVLLLCLPMVVGAQEPELHSEITTAAVIVADPPLVKTVGDTVSFNPDALYIEEDAVLEDILRKIPGMEVEDGTITMYGRKVEKLLVGGRLYYGGDIVTGLKNIQGDMVQEIKAYVRQSDFARVSGIEDGEDETVLDVRIKRKFMGSWKGRVQGGGSYPLRYLAAGNAGILSDSLNTNIIANFRNTPLVPMVTTTRPTKLGTGSDGDRDRREAGVSYSKSGKHLDIDASVKYNGNSYEQKRNGWSRNLYSNRSDFVLSSASTTGYSNEVKAQADFEWKPDKSWTVLVNPYFYWRGNSSHGSPESMAYSTDPRLDEDAAALNRVVQETFSLSLRTEGRLAVQATHRFPKRGRSATLRVSESISGGSNDNDNQYNGETFKKNTVTSRGYHVESPWVRNDVLVQGSWNEPLGKGFHIQALVNSRFIHNSIDRDYFFLETGLPDPEFSSSGTYSGVLMNIQGNFRYIRKKLNITAGVSLKPVWNNVRYTTKATEKLGSFQFYTAPNLTLRFDKSKTEYVNLRYRSTVNTPSPAQLIPIRSGTNPLYIREGNASLKSSFTHLISFTYNYSDPKNGRSLVSEANAKIVKNAFASSTEYNPDTGGKIIRYCNIDGNWNAGGSVVYSQSFRQTPLSLTNHFEGNYSESTALFYNSSTKADEMSLLRRTALRERLDAILRWKRLTATLSGGGEYTLEKSLRFPELQQEPYSLFCSADLAVRLPYRWRITSYFGFYASRGHGFEELDRNLYLLNASVSKSFLDGNLTIRLTGNDLLDQSTHVTYSFGVSNLNFNVWNGFGRMILLQAIWKFSGRS